MGHPAALGSYELRRFRKRFPFGQPGPLLSHARWGGRPHGNDGDRAGIHVLSLREGRVSAIWMLADELQRLAQVGAPRVIAGKAGPGAGVWTRAMDELDARLHRIG